MYYDNITEKMIPGIFIITNNKTEEGYLDSFIYIMNYIDHYSSDRIENYEFKTFTTDFETALFNAFNIIFNKDKKLNK